MSDVLAETTAGVTLEAAPEPSTSLTRAPSKKLMLFSGRGSRELTSRIARKLEVAPGEVELETFANGEVYCRYRESVRGADVFIVQSTSRPVNDNVMELLIMIDAAKGASAKRITAVLPWFGYARQDKKSLPREPITARLVARLLEVAGADRVLTMDLHAGQIQGFFQVPADHMTAMPMLCQYFLDQGMGRELVVVSPDAGRVKMAEKFRSKLGADFAILTKERPAHGVAETGYIIGDVKGRTALLVDDMIDTAGTLCEAARSVREAGATRVLATATHGVFSPPAYEALADSVIEQVLVTDTIPLQPGAPPKITVISVADILSRSIRSIFADESVSEIFAGENQLF